MSLTKFHNINKLEFYKTQFVKRDLYQLPAWDEGEEWRQRAIKCGLVDEVTTLIQQKYRYEPGDAITDMWISDLLGKDEDIHKLIEDEEKKAPTTFLYSLVDTSFKLKEKGSLGDRVISINIETTVAGVLIDPFLRLEIRFRDDFGHFPPLIIKEEDGSEHRSDSLYEDRKTILAAYLAGLKTNQTGVDYPADLRYIHEYSQVIVPEAAIEEIENWKQINKAGEAKEKPKFFFIHPDNDDPTSVRSPFKDIFSNEISPDMVIRILPWIRPTIPETSDFAIALLQGLETKIRWKLTWEPEKGYKFQPLFPTPPYS